MVALVVVVGGLWRPMLHARSPKRNQALYIHHRVTHVQVHVCLSRSKRRTFEFPPRVARDPRLYSHDDERSSDGTPFQKRLAMPPTESPSVVFCHLCCYIVIYILLPFFPPAYFCFAQKNGPISLSFKISFPSFFISYKSL